MLGFPCNQFGGQEPGTNAEILEFAQSRYHVDFPMFAKIEVNGPGQAPLYEYLTSAKPNAEGNPAIAWNFTKFLVGPNGEVIERFEPMTTPEEIGAFIAAL